MNDAFDRRGTAPGRLEPNDMVRHRASGRYALVQAMSPASADGARLHLADGWTMVEWWQTGRNGATARGCMAAPSGEFDFISRAEA